MNTPSLSDADWLYFQLKQQGESYEYKISKGDFRCVKSPHSDLWMITKYHGVFNDPPFELYLSNKPLPSVAEELIGIAREWLDINLNGIVKIETSVQVYQEYERCAVRLTTLGYREFEPRRRIVLAEKDFPIKPLSHPKHHAEVCYEVSFQWRHCRALLLADIVARSFDEILTGTVYKQKNQLDLPSSQFPQVIFSESHFQTCSVGFPVK